MPIGDAFDHASTFNSGKNGNVTASLTLSPPPSDITCPSRTASGLTQERRFWTASARRPSTADAHVAATGTASNPERLETISASRLKPIAYAGVVEAWATTSAESATAVG